MSSDSSPSARALASRRNGARSCGPRTAAGKAQVAKNALKHGLSARHLVLLDDEDASAFAAFEAAARTELAPAGEFQADLVGASSAPRGGRGAPTASRPRSSRAAWPPRGRPTLVTGRRRSASA